jgi:hypothetical protein
MRRKQARKEKRGRYAQKQKQRTGGKRKKSRTKKWNGGKTEIHKKARKKNEHFGGNTG